MFMSQLWSLCTQMSKTANCLDLNSPKTQIFEVVLCAQNEAAVTETTSPLVSTMFS